MEEHAYLLLVSKYHDQSDYVFCDSFKRLQEEIEDYSQDGWEIEMAAEIVITKRFVELED